MDTSRADIADSADTGSAAPAGLLSARAAAAALGVNERTVRRAIERGILPAHKYAGSFRIAPDDLERYAAQLAVPCPTIPAGPRAGRMSPPSIAPVRLVRPPLRTAPPPVPLTALVGREREIEAVADLLHAGARLVTLTGPGGVGKTRLALAVAARIGPAFADGVAVVQLAAVTDPVLVASTIARALELSEAGDRPPDERLRSVLRERRFLLVLDNFEQVVAAAPLVADLLASCPQLAILVTSREVLRVSGEHVYAVPPLDPEQATRLFVDRARAVQARLPDGEPESSIVTDICRRLDNLPLAIELAAARSALLPPPALLTRLERRLPLLSGGARDQPARLRTMRDAIAWSHDLLTSEEQRLFRRLGVFAGGFTLEAAEDVSRELRVEGQEKEPVSLDSGLSTLDLVASLLSKSLLRQEGTDDAPRFGMLETVREFALERLEESGETDAVRRRHADWCLDLLERAEASLLGEWDGRWLDRLDAEQDNVRAALAWTCDRGDATAAFRLAAGLFPYWFIRARFIEGRRWFERVLALSGVVPPPVRAKVLHAAGEFDRIAGDFDQAEVRAKESQETAGACGDACCLAKSLWLLSEIAEDREDYAGAAPSREAAYALFRQIGDRFWTAVTAGGLGDLAMIRRALVEAEGHYREVLAIHDELGNDWGRAYVLKDLASVTYLRGDVALAAASWRESVRLHWEQRQPWHVEGRLQSLAMVATATGDHIRAARIFGAADALNEILGTPMPPRQHTAIAPSIAAIRAALGDDAFAAEWAAGRAMTIDEAVAEASLVAPPSTEAPHASLPSDPAREAGLSPRELDVLRLIADGRSNQAIADALFLSRGTVTKHVEHILNKLGVDSRVAAAAWAIRHGVV